MDESVKAFFVNILSSLIAAAVIGVVAESQLGLPILYTGGTIFLVFFIVLTLQRRFLSTNINSDTIEQNDDVEQTQLGNLKSATGHQAQPDLEPPYRVFLGKRHRTLREEYLKLNLREMADFYGFNKVAELEAYENGEEEFPNKNIKDLIDFFFIRKDYFEGDFPFVFDTFNEYSSVEIGKLLDEEFRPYFLCSSQEREYLFSYIVFYKREGRNGREYSRVVRSEHMGSFEPNIGIDPNIGQIIYEMIRRKIDWMGASVLTVNKTVWSELESGQFYRAFMFFSGRDSVCDLIFREWYQYAKENMNLFVSE